MAKIGRRRLAKELVRLLKEQPGSRQKLIEMCAAYLIETKQSKQLHLLINDVANELLETEGQMLADVRSAFPLTDSTRSKITTLLSKQRNVKNVELTETVEPNLVGGIILKTPSHELDASIATRLKQISLA